MKVILYTHVDGICQHFRFAQYVEHWRAMGIEATFVDGLRLNVAEGTIDAAPFDGADVVVLARYYYTADGRDIVTDSVLPWLAGRTDLGLIWDTDDDLFSVSPWNGYQADSLAARPQIEALAAGADLVTVATPYLARVYAHLRPREGRTAVLRNAVGLADYTAGESGSAALPSGRPRLVYYGVGPRMLDMLGGRDAGRGYAGRVLMERRGRTTNVFVGNPETVSWAPGLWDEVRPAVPIERWPAYLAESHGQIGFAPLTGHRFDYGKSELHWLEYTACGMASVVADLPGGGGPYAIAGDCALHARGHQQWLDGYDALVRSADLRAELVGRSREVVARDYALEVRAAEWAEAFRWAAEHPGTGDRARLAAWEP